MSSSARAAFLQLLAAKQDVLALGQRTRSSLRERIAPGTWLSTGRVRNGTEPCTVLYRGNVERLGELEALLFDASPTQRQELTAARQVAVDIYVEPAWPWQYSQGDTHVIQSWLDASCAPVDADAYLSKAINDGVRRTLKRASQAGYHKTVSVSRSDAAYFYGELFEPMARARFGSMVSYGSLDLFLSMNGRTMNTEVVFLERAGERVAGVAFLVSPARRTLRVWAYGIRQDLLADARLRAELMALLNAEAVRAAAASGYALNLGLTRPFADDGVLVYKRRWGAELIPSDGARFALRFASEEARRRLLRVAPLLEIGAEGVRPCPLAAEPGAPLEPVGEARPSWAE